MRNFYKPTTVSAILLNISEFHRLKGRPLKVIHPSKSCAKVLNISFHMWRETTDPWEWTGPHLATSVASKAERQKNRARSSPNGRRIRVKHNPVVRVISAAMERKSEAMFDQTSNHTFPSRLDHFVFHSDLVGWEKDFGYRRRKPTAWASRKFLGRTFL